MRKIIIALIFIAASISSNAQILNQDAEGKSSINYQGGNIGIDITQTRLSFTYNNLGYSPSKKLYNDSRYIWGVSAQGENKESIANLFSRGEIIPQTQLSGMFGWRWRKEDVSPTTKSELEEKYELRKDIINDILDLNIKLSNETDEVKKLVIRDNLKKLEEEQFIIQNNISQLNSLKRRQVVMPYVRAGRSAIAFKHAVTISNNAEGVSTKFESEKFKGNFVGIGLNLETGSFLFGGYIENEHVNNFSHLSKATYTITTTEVVENQTIEAEEKITAYKGNYDTYNRVNYYIDCIYFQSLPEMNYLAWNVYYRYRQNNNAQATPSYSDIGLGAYFFNQGNKFLGGVYIEAPDLNQDLERSKENPDLRDLHNRLTFGIVARFNFSSILN